jgi:hypothetical protein
MNNENFNDEKFRDILSKNITVKMSNVGKELIEFRSSFQQAAQTIIDNVSLILNSVEDNVLQDLREELTQFEKQLRNKIEPEFRTRLEKETRQKVEADLEEQLMAARQAATDVAEKKRQAKLETLIRALREISQQKTQVDILTSYLNNAAIFAPRVAFFVVKSGNIVGWQARGFEGEFSNDAIKSLVFPVDRDTLFRQVCESKMPFIGKVLSLPGISEFISKLGQTAPDSVCAIPLVVRDKTVAILYADSGLTENNPLDGSSLELMATVVSLTVELSSAKAKLGIKPTENPAESYPQTEKATESSNAPEKVEPTQPASDQKPAQAVEKPRSITQTEMSPDTQEQHTEFRAPEPPQSGETPSLSAVAATQSDAPPPLAMETQRAVSEPVQIFSSQHSHAGIGDVDENDQKLHNDARRFARLLVSEIKLYNEQKVHEGRRDKTLYGLLRDDIDKSREMYERRVSPNVAAKIDYFYDELVRILADNQVEALGKDCPGPVLAR